LNLAVRLLSGHPREPKEIANPGRSGENKFLKFCVSIMIYRLEDEGGLVVHPKVQESFYASTF
jgi:hypothetical protein